MTAGTIIERHLGGVRAAVDASDALRLPGGDALARVLALMTGNRPAKALEMLAPLVDGPAIACVARVLEAVLLDATGRRGDAKAVLARFLEDPDAGYDMLCLAGDLFLDWRMAGEACRAYDRAVALAPHSSHAILRRGKALSEAGEVTGALDDLRRATLLQPNLAEAHRALGDELRDASMPEAAIASYRRALEIDAADETAAAALEALIASLVPAWHAAMLNDARRNDAFDAAIRRAVGHYAAAHGGSADGMHVLDIGTGTGLLAMMAARAGAGRVTACESVGPLADIARYIVARNGMADRIAVLHGRSTGLEVGVDLPRRADLLTAEIVDAGLLGEAILPTIADARARLLAPDAPVIPCAAAVFAMPVESAGIDAERRVDRAAGFDISAFNRLAPKLYLQTDLAKYDWRPLAAPAVLFRFDFTRAAPEAGETSARVIPRSDGTAHAVALWFELSLDGETTLATGPMDPPTHWKQAVFALETPVALNRNDPVRLTARHDGRRIRLALGG